ncbi:hypothetical protein ACFFRR_006683 [Megaselia abdita]
MLSLDKIFPAQLSTTPSGWKNKRFVFIIVVLYSILITANGRRPSEPYYGSRIGQLTTFAHGINGTVYAVDETTLFIKNFVYDGTGPDAFFWVGKTSRPSPDGYIIPYPEDYIGSDPPVLQAHNYTDIILRLPMGKRIRDIRWLSVWCRRFTVDFGEVFIPPNLDVPKPKVLPEFKRLAHNLRSSNISILDAKTFYIPNLHYDGAGPDAYFWVGNGSEPNIMGTKVPNERGSLEPLSGYQGEDIEIQLPGDLQVYDIDWLSVWCVEYRHNFGHVYIPKDLDVPPALGQTKLTTASPTMKTKTAHTQINTCKEIIKEKLQVKWEIKGDSLYVELLGRIDEDQYMAFGLSGDNGKSQMVRGDITLAFYDKISLVYRAVDYFLSDLSQCDGRSGVCPDERIGGKNDAVLLAGDRKKGVTIIKFKRPLKTFDSQYDINIPLDQTVSVIGAIGPLNSLKEANAHSHIGDDVNVENIEINFSLKNDNKCTKSLFNIKDSPDEVPWPVNSIANEFILTARIGPTGGKRGYTAITGYNSWGIAWYINDLLIPEIKVVRGETYTFIVEGGNDKFQPAKFHPFYITNSSEGGLGQRNVNEIRDEYVYAGVVYDSEGYPVPMEGATGRYCEWKHNGVDSWRTSGSFEDYTRTLYLDCDQGEPGYLNWTVPTDAPDLLYYQCFTHRNLGWKIHVTDSAQRLFVFNIYLATTISLSLVVLNRRIII